MISLENLYKLRVLCEKDKEAFKQILSDMPKDAQLYLLNHWYFTMTPDGRLGTRLEQILPWHEDWYITIWKPARRWGKSFGASNNIVDFMLENPKSAWIGVAANYDDAKTVMIEGDSGILGALKKRGYEEQQGFTRKLPKPKHYIYNSSDFVVKLDNGSYIKFYTAEKASKLRGKGVSGIWLDEVFTYFEEEDIERRNEKITAIYNQCVIVLSQAKKPKVLISSTPTPVQLLKKFYIDMKETPEDYRYIVGTVLDNPWLSEEYKSRAIKELGNTRLGRQELYGEECWDTPGSLWDWDMFKYIDHKDIPLLDRIIVSVDPAVSNKATSDETGIVVAAKGRNGHYYILEDASLKATPRKWAERVIQMYEKHKASRIVFETNQGGDMVEETLRHVKRAIPLKGVRASKGKYARAEPIATLYEQGKVFHVKGLNKLEGQLTEYNPEMYKGSPDRLDALVWALHELSQCGGGIYVF